MAAGLPGVLFATSGRSAGRTLASALLAARLGGTAKVVLADWGFDQSPLLRYFDIERRALAHAGGGMDGLLVSPGLRLFSSAFFPDLDAAAERLRKLAEDADLLVCPARSVPRGLGCDFKVGFVVFDYQGESPFKAAAMVAGMRQTCGKVMPLPSWVDTSFLGLGAQRKRAQDAFAKADDGPGEPDGRMVRLELPLVTDRAAMGDLLSMRTEDAALQSFLAEIAGVVQEECLPRSLAEGAAPFPLWEMRDVPGPAGAEAWPGVGLLDILGIRGEPEASEAPAGEPAEAGDVPPAPAKDGAGDEPEEEDQVGGPAPADNASLMRQLESWAGFDIDEIYPTLKERIAEAGLTPLGDSTRTVEAYAEFNRKFAGWGPAHRKDAWLPALVHCLGMACRAHRSGDPIELPARGRVEDLFAQADDPLARSPELAAVRMANLAGFVAAAAENGDGRWLESAEAVVGKVAGMAPDEGGEAGSKAADLRRMALALALRLPRFAEAGAGARAALEAERDALPDGLRALLAGDEIGEKVREIRAAMEDLI